MIKFETGDILTSNADVICHQVNCRGIMGAGLAKQIRDRYLEVFREYRKLCINQHMDEDNMLGSVQFIETDNHSKIIANLFAQGGFSLKERQTDYLALENCLRNVETLMYGKIVAIPYKIGCGLGGGNWEDTVFPMIEDIFKDSDVMLEIWKLK